MNTLLVTNILLAVIVLCTLLITVLGTIVLVHIISATRKIRDLAKEFDDDVHRARSFFLALKEKFGEKLFGKRKAK